MAGAAGELHAAWESLSVEGAGEVPVAAVERLAVPLWAAPHELASLPLAEQWQFRERRVIFRARRGAARWRTILQQDSAGGKCATAPPGAEPGQRRRWQGWGRG